MSLICDSPFSISLFKFRKEHFSYLRQISKNEKEVTPEKNRRICGCFGTEVGCSFLNACNKKINRAADSTSQKFPIARIGSRAEFTKMAKPHFPQLKQLPYFCALFPVKHCHRVHASPDWLVI